MVSKKVCIIPPRERERGIPRDGDPSPSVNHLPHVVVIVTNNHSYDDVQSRKLFGALFIKGLFTQL